MSYLVLARKWRPQQLTEILGQNHVTRTLTNALSMGRIAHAFLFTGARGVGKTSAARILAKALCCEASAGPTATPCGECSACLEIGEGRATDVFEIDAASNTGVANVREIIDNVRYLPSKARFKIYIIDEVHMLSTGAFNALLKTLEEPPSHVKFILATTDVHKVPVTILSRCQRYDFRRIPVGEIALRLSEILTAESIEHEPSALTLVARESEGSMRDAQSLVEQLLTYAGGNKLDAELVREALGVADRAVLSGVLDALTAREPGRVIELVGEIYDRGLDVKRFGDALVEYARDLLVARLVSDPGKLLDRPKDEIRELIEKARGLQPVELERMFTQLARVVEEVGGSAFPRFTLEVGLASLAEQPPRVELGTLVEQLDRLELKLATGPLPTRAASPGGGRGRPFRGASEDPSLSFAAPSPRTVASKSPPSEEGPPPEDAPPPFSADELAAPPSSGPLRPPEVDPLRSFAQFVDLVRARRPTLSGSLAQVRPLAFEKGRVELGAETRFDESALGSDEPRRYLQELLGEYFGAPTSLAIRRVERRPSEPVPQEIPATLDEAERAESEKRRATKEREARGHSAVKTISDELGATIAKVRVFDE